ncbi:ABC transporter permease [uncultured Olsenella sp.]|uniref:ABC transporter permease n=1 Tax=uncultured Olsenella sp. TaxID=190764 RepID=UPI0026DAA547|nr:ABC transporter permease subunit [uncultured Olsenella sp.]
MAEKTKLKGAPGEGDATAATAGAGASEFARGEELPRAQSPARQFLKKFLRRKTAVAGFVFIVLMLVIAVIGPSVVPYDPNQYDYSALLSGPTAAHVWGTDEFGRDVFSRLVAGTQLSLGTALTASVIGTAAGVVFGLIAGFCGGLVDAFIMRVCDVMFAFPGILLAIAVVAIIGPGLTNVMIGVAVFTVPSFARIIRGAVLEVRSELYVEAARSVGCSSRRIMFIHILPGTMQALIVNFTMNVGGAILSASSLSFLGFGASVTQPEWGAMLSQSRNYLATAPHLVLFPGLLIFLTVLAFNLFGDGLRDTLDPKLN